MNSGKAVKYTNEQKKEMVLEYLKEKYKEEFVGMQYMPSEDGMRADSYYVRAQARDESEGFEVWGRVNKKDGTYEMTDGYFGIYIKDEYEKVMRTFIDEFYSEYKIFIKTDTAGYVPQRLNKDTKIDEIYKEGEDYGFEADVYVYVKESDAKDIDIKEAIEKIALKKKENRLLGEINIFVIRDDIYDNTDIDTQEKRALLSEKESQVKRAGIYVDLSLELRRREWD